MAAEAGHERTAAKRADNGAAITMTPSLVVMIDRRRVVPRREFVILPVGQRTSQTESAADRTAAGPRGPAAGPVQLALTVTPGKSSVRNGVSGRPAPLYMLHTGLSAQA